MTNSDDMVKVITALADRIVEASRDPNRDAHDLDDLVQDGIALAEKILLFNRLLVDDVVPLPASWANHEKDYRMFTPGLDTDNEP